MALRDDELPVLNEVVRTGDETIIRSTRLRRVDIDELDSTSTGPLHFELPAHLQFDMLDAEDDTPCDPAELLSTHIPTEKTPLSVVRSVPPATDSPSESALEVLIDEIIDNHIIALREDLRTLLERARELP